MTPDWMREPTPKQCSAHERVYEDDEMIAHAVWYPQMGGYVGKAVVKMWKNPSSGNECFDAYVWHDGEFPFRDDVTGTKAVHIHHCSPEQFVRFGELVRSFMPTQSEE